MTITLHGYWRSSASYRVRIALGIKGLRWQDAPVDLRSGVQGSEAFRALNPQGLVPMLVDGTVRISQSLAIIEYLEETRPSPRLLPDEPAARAQVRAAALAIACDIHPLNNLRVLRYLKSELGHSDAETDAWARHWIRSGFEALETIAAAADGRYLFGSSVTIADVCLVPQLYNARRVNTDLAAFPRLLAIESALAELPAFAGAAPERQADAPR